MNIDAIKALIEMEYHETANLQDRDEARDELTALTRLARLVQAEDGSDGILLKAIKSVEQDLREVVNPQIRKLGYHPPDLCQKELAQALAEARLAMEGDDDTK